MPLTPEDVVRKTFSYARLRGYAPNDVDAFLEEVVAELRRLNLLVDELRAAQVHVGDEIPQSERRAQMEMEQLDQVRKERADLVQELAALQSRYDELHTAIAESESILGYPGDGSPRLSPGQS